MWQSRYKAKLIDEPEYLSRVIHYLHLNPVRAGLTEDPSKCTFSGHRELKGKIRKPVCDVDEALQCFGGTVKSARRSYASGMKQAMKDEESVYEARGEIYRRPIKFRKFPLAPIVSQPGRSRPS